MRARLGVIPAVVVAAGIVAAGVGLVVTHGRHAINTAAAATPATTTVLAAADTATLTPAQVYQQAAPGVVVITDTISQKVAATAFSPASTQKVGALGSGFVLDTQGHILTNDHVVQSASGIRVGFTGGTTYPATIVGSDPASDLAVLRVQVPVSLLKPLVWADSGTVQVGDPAYAIGNPFGLDETMTAGIVSATGRDIQAPDGITIPNTIQTDAAINHGNSGGPLLDSSGQVVGVNSQIEGGTVDANVGVGFSISSDVASSIADELIATGHALHAYLGVEVAAIDPAAAKVVPGLPTQGVQVVAVVKGSPAAKAGLVPATRQVKVGGLPEPVGGDAIVALDGTPLTSSEQLLEAVTAAKPGDQLTLDVVRAGHPRTVAVTLANVPAKP